MSIPQADVRPRPRSGVALLALAGVAWGTGGLLGSLLADEAGLSPLAVAAYRLGLGGLLVGVLVVGATPFRARPEPRLGADGHRRTAWRRIGILAVLAAFQACYFTAVALSSVGLATLVTIGTGRWWSPPSRPHAVAPPVARPSPSSSRWPGSACCGAPDRGNRPLLAVAGSTAAVLAGASFATMTLVGARPVPGLDAATTTAVSFVLGGLLLVGPALLVGGPAMPSTAAGFGLVAPPVPRRSWLCSSR
ncbi:MAG: hypothetical protein K0R87_2925 [Pseudonocardia sp.]|nr:hypothetical protein [Pseudonocardia sp.]